MSFTYHRTIRFKDTDAAGVVYFANILAICNEAYEESLEASGIDFRNELVYNERLNTYTYRNFYNGAGIAVGDINNDGLQDLYFCGRQDSVWCLSGFLHFFCFCCFEGRRLRCDLGRV